MLLLIIVYFSTAFYFLYLFSYAFFLFFLSPYNFFWERLLSFVERDRNDLKPQVKLYWLEIFAIQSS
jgi:hypothetical protein